MIAVWAFWLVCTRPFHPTMTLAVITTSSLVVAYALAAYLNHLVLLPRFDHTRRWGSYVWQLMFMMILLTALALSVIRLSYHHLLGPDSDPYGTYYHFGIDFMGMAVHLMVAAWLAWAERRWNPVR